MLSLAVAAAGGAVVAWRHWSGASALSEPGAMWQYGIIVGAEFGVAAAGAAAMVFLGRSATVSARLETGHPRRARGVFHSTPSPEGIVQTVESDGMPGRVCLETVTFAERTGTTVVTQNTVYQSARDRDRALRFDMVRDAALADRAESRELLIEGWAAGLPGSARSKSSAGHVEADVDVEGQGGAGRLVRH